MKAGLISVAAAATAIFGLCGNTDAATLYNLTVDISAPFSGVAFLGTPDELYDFGLYDVIFHATIPEETLETGALFTIQNGSAQLQASFALPFDNFQFSGHADTTLDVSGDLPGRATASLGFEGFAPLFATDGMTSIYSGDGVSTATFSVADASGVSVTFSDQPGGAVTFNAFLTPVPLPSSVPMFGTALLALGVAGYGMRRKTSVQA